MKKQKQTLQNALPIVAAAYSEKFGVDITIGGNVAYTDGKSINLPVIPDNAPQAQAVWGYLAHEGAHIRFTDFSVKRRPGIHSDMVNIIEDMRIERLMIRAYPGTAETLLETCDYMVSAGHYQMPESGMHPAKILSSYCLYYLQAKGVGQPPLLPILAKTETVIKSDFPAKMVVGIQELLDEAIIKCDSTQSASAYADKLLALIKDIEEDGSDQNDQDGQSQQGDDQNDQQDSSSDQQSQSQGGDQGDEDDDQQAGDQQGSDSSGDSDDQQAGQSGQGKQDDSSESKDQNASSDQSEQSDSSSGSQGQGGSDDEQQGDSQQESQSSSGAGGSKQQSISEQLEQAEQDDLIGDPRDALKRDLQAANQEPHGNEDTRSVPKAEGVSKGCASSLRDAKSVSAGIRQQLWGMVQASQRTARLNTRSGRRINTSRLARVKAGETKVFVKPALKTSPNTAVHILVDMSSSMASGAYIHAREAGLAIALALESIPGVNPAVTFFDSEFEPRLRQGLKHGERVEPANFDVRPSGTTPMAEAIWYAAHELIKCKEERKLIICITDGQPDNFAATQKVIGLCSDSGFELIGVGIAEPSVNRLFANSIVINQAKDLRSTLFKLMESSLVA